MSKSPKYHAYSITEVGKTRQAVWTRIGAAWPTDKGDGLNIRLDALPFNFDGKLTLLPPKSGRSSATTFEQEVA